MIQNIQKTQQKCKLHLTKYSNCKAQFNHNTAVIPVTCLYNLLTVRTLGVPSHWEGKRGLKPAQAHCCLQNSFVCCLVFVLCVRLSHVFIPSCPSCAGLANSGKHSHHQLIHSTADSCLFKAKATLQPSPLCWDKVCFLCNSGGQSQPALFPELHDHITLAHLPWVSFHFRGLLVSHSKLSLVSERALWG